MFDKIQFVTDQFQSDLEIALRMSTDETFNVKSVIYNLYLAENL